MPQTAVKISTPIVEHARAAAKLHSRSISGQVEHWVRIGRAIERSPGYDHARIEAALRAEVAYDDLTGEEQRVYHDRLDEMVGTYSQDEIDAYKRLGELADQFDAQKA